MRLGPVGVGVWECLWGRVRAGVLGGGGTAPPFKRYPGAGPWAVVNSEPMPHILQPPSPAAKGRDGQNGTPGRIAADGCCPRARGTCCAAAPSLGLGAGCLAVARGVVELRCCGSSAGQKPRKAGGRPDHSLPTVSGLEQETCIKIYRQVQLLNGRTGTGMPYKGRGVTGGHRSG